MARAAHSANVVRKPISSTSLFTMRHGHASPPAIHHNQKTDVERKLTEEGKEMVRKTARCMKDLGFSPKGVIVSSADRAKESAQVFLEVFGITDVRTVVAPGLYEWSEMDEAVRDIRFSPNMMLYHNSNKHREALLRFEQNRIMDTRNALTRLTDVKGDILVVSHAWCANCVAMAHDPVRCDEYRRTILQEAHGILLTEFCRPLTVDPTGIVL